MNKKLRRLMQPNLALFFVVMALFCAAAVALQEYILAVAEGCATLLLLGCYQWLSVRRRRALADYVQATSEMLQHTSDGEMPFPVALVKLNDNELVWYNRAFAELTHVRPVPERGHPGPVGRFSGRWKAGGRGRAPL